MVWHGIALHGIARRSSVAASSSLSLFFSFSSSSAKCCDYCGLKEMLGGNVTLHATTFKFICLDCSKRKTTKMNVKHFNACGMMNMNGGDCTGCS